VHAPSLSHAVTAGVLRSAYLSHNANMSGDSALSFDLTSARAMSTSVLMAAAREIQLATARSSSTSSPIPTTCWCRRLVRV